MKVFEGTLFSQPHYWNPTKYVRASHFADEEIEVQRNLELTFLTLLGNFIHVSHQYLLCVLCVANTIVYTVKSTLRSLHDSGKNKQLFKDSHRYKYICVGKERNKVVVNKNNRNHHWDLGGVRSQETSLRKWCSCRDLKMYGNRQRKGEGKAFEAEGRESKKTREWEEYATSRRPVWLEDGE